MNPVKIFTKSTCGFCRQAKEFLIQQGVPYEEVDASIEDGRDQLYQLGFHVVPVLIINGQTIERFADL
ncbi:glutaredoxin family protein [Alicyclobacillus suci]|uniref:glutaredoxin family protein n=1 Tax=Alicyclobacillus suci TaxID=2816080 RepID=UPI001A8CF169|nr:glutaredoxin family protein [Alicyclobacillus suci]